MESNHTKIAHELIKDAQQNIDYLQNLIRQNIVQSVMPILHICVYAEKSRLKTLERLSKDGCDLAVELNDIKPVVIEDE